MLGTRRPVILYHKPTARCDCRCRFCDAWIHQPSEEDVLPDGKIIGLIDQAERAGITIIIWSNLSRENRDQVEEILRFASQYKIGVEFFPTARF